MDPRPTVYQTAALTTEPLTDFFRHYIKVTVPHSAQGNCKSKHEARQVVCCNCLGSGSTSTVPLASRCPEGQSHFRPALGRNGGEGAYLFGYVGIEDEKLGQGRAFMHGRGHGCKKQPGRRTRGEEEEGSSHAHATAQTPQKGVCHAFSPLEPLLLT